MYNNTMNRKGAPTACARELRQYLRINFRFLINKILSCVKNIILFNENPRVERSMQPFGQGSLMQRIDVHRYYLQ